MPAERDHAHASTPVEAKPLTSEEEDALQLAEELRDRIRRERETARQLGAYLEVSTAAEPDLS